MNIAATRRPTLLVVCLLSFACQRQVTEKETLPFGIVATDAGFEAPDRLAAGLRYIVFANRGTEIHEGMLVKLPTGDERRRLRDGRQEGIAVAGTYLGLFRPGANIAWSNRRDVVKSTLLTTHEES